jgi:hypothetical protein
MWLLVFWSELSWPANSMQISVILQIGVFADLLFAYQSKEQDSLVHC